jgi:hypothetical protein
MTEEAVGGLAAVGGIVFDGAACLLGLDASVGFGNAPQQYAV